MTQVNQCDVCKALPCVGNELEFTGYTWDTSKKQEMGYWKGYVCYSCIYKARKAIGILQDSRVEGKVPFV